MKKLKTYIDENTWQDKLANSPNLKPVTYIDATQESLMYDFIHSKVDKDRGVLETLEQKLDNVTTLLAFLYKKCAVTDEELYKEIEFHLDDDLMLILQFPYVLVEE